MARKHPSFWVSAGRHSTIMLAWSNGFMRRTPFVPLLLLAAYAFAQDTISVESHEPMFVCGDPHSAPNGPCATPPRALTKSDPIYAEKARQARVEGTVALQVFVGTDGKPYDIQVTKSLGHGLDENAAAAVRRWMFEPGTYEGKPVPVQMTVTVNFRLTPRGAAPSEPQAANSVEIKGLYSTAYEAYNRHDYQTAANIARRATALSPDYKSAWNLLGISLSEMGQLDAAASALKKLIEIEPDSVTAYNNLGRVYWKQRKYDDAIAQFQRQLVINPQDHYAHSNLGMLLRDQKKCEAAIPELQKALALTPNNGNVLLAMGECDLDLGNKAKGISEMEQATSTSSSANMWNSAAYQLALRNVELDRAEKWAETAVTMESLQLNGVSLEHLAPTQLSVANSLASYWDTLGWVYFLRDKANKAEMYVRAAWELRSSVVIGSHLAQIYEKLGRREDAIHIYAMAAAAGSLSSEADPDTIAEVKQKLTNLVGSKQQAAVLIEHGQADLLARHSVRVANPTKSFGTAEFMVAVIAPNKIAEVRQISGSESLKPFAETLKATQLPMELPDVSEIELPRRGTLTCSADGENCQFLLLGSNEAADLARKEAASDTIASLPAAPADPHIYQNSSIGMKVSLPDEWKLMKEEPGSASQPWNAILGKPGTLAFVVLTREHLESTPDLYRHMLEASVSQSDDFKRTGETSVVRDGISGTRWTMSWSDKGVAYRGMVEFFSLGDDHYRVTAAAPTEVYPRYGQDFEDMLRSVRFPLLRASPDLLFEASKP